MSSMGLGKQEEQTQENAMGQAHRGSAEQVNIGGNQ